MFQFSCPHAAARRAGRTIRAASGVRCRPKLGRHPARWWPTSGRYRRDGRGPSTIQPRRGSPRVRRSVPPADAGMTRRRSRPVRQCGLASCRRRPARSGTMSRVCQGICAAPRRRRRAAGRRYFAGCARFFIDSFGSADLPFAASTFRERSSHRAQRRLSLRVPSVRAHATSRGKPARSDACPSRTTQPGRAYHPAPSAARECCAWQRRRRRPCIRHRVSSVPPWRRSSRW